MSGLKTLRATADVILSAEISLPPLLEQEEIARIVGGLLAKETAAMAIVEKALAEIATLKRTILTRAFRGEPGTNEPAELAPEF